jgi:hypothetical protein
LSWVEVWPNSDMALGDYDCDSVSASRSPFRRPLMTRSRGGSEGRLVSESFDRFLDRLLRQPRSHVKRYLGLPLRDNMVSTRFISESRSL